MPTLLNLGRNGEPPVSLGDDCLLPKRVFARQPATQGARAAVAAALAEPVGFPPLSKSIVPGDRIAVALDEGIPNLIEVGAALIDSLTASGIQPAHVSLVTNSRGDEALLRSGVGGVLPTGVNVVRHDPTDENELCFAGVTREDDQSLLINRVLFDADLAIPVTIARPPTDRENRGAYNGLYPAFADAACRQEYLKTAWDRHDWWASRTEEAGWLIGAPFVVRVVPGPRGSLAAVVAGAPGEADVESQAAASRQWRCEADQQAGLVVATIAGDPDRQTWDDLARALAAADQVAAPGGAVAVVSEIGLPLGRSLARLRAEGDPEAALRKLAKDARTDTWAARQVAQALLRGPVFLKSRLADDLVEDLGLAPIASGAELERLASRFAPVALLEDAPHLELTTGATA